MDNLKYLLKELNIINQRIIDREKNQDTFNVFDFMFKRNDEVNLHSRFISVLMDPNGSHGMKDLFLRLFIKRIGLNFRYDLSSLKTFPNENNRSEYHEIDLLLIDRQYQSAVILENKIEACDSNHDEEGQLERYYRRISQEEGIPADSITVIYLSLDRDAPSDDSVDKSGQFPELKDKVININYGSEILDWLRECVKESYNRPLLRETISQYIKLIEKMTNNDTSEEDIKSIMKLVGKNSDNLKSAKLLMDNYYHLYWWAVYLFWKELSEEFVKRGYISRQRIENEEITDLVHGGPQKRKVNFNLDISGTSGTQLTVNADYNDYVCVGMSDEDIKRGQKIIAKSFFKKNEQSLSLKSCEGWAFYKYVDFEGAEGLMLSDFDDNETFALLSETERTKAISKIVGITDCLVFAFENFDCN